MTTPDPTTTPEPDTGTEDTATPPVAKSDDTDANDDTTRAERRQHRDSERYRSRLREVETQRDTLADRVAAMQRAEAERLASQHLRDGRDLWAGGIDLGALLDENGDLVPELVTDAARDVRAQRPHWGYSPSAPTSQVTSDGKPTADTGPSFIDAFKPRTD